MSVSAPMAVIAVRRARDYCGVARSMRILINEQTIGSVWYGGRKCVDLPPGSYSIRVAMDWCRSEPFEVDLQAGEVAELEGGLRWRGLGWRKSLLAAFFAPGRVFVVRPASDEFEPDRWREILEGLGALAGAAMTMYMLFRFCIWLDS